MEISLNTNFFTRGIGDNVLFLHGWGGNKDSFCNITNILEKTHRITCIDFWGFGESENPPCSGWSVMDYALQLKKFVDSHHLTNFSVVAHSFGGRVAIVFAALYPQMISKLMLVDSAGLRRFSIKRTCKVAIFRFKRILAKLHIINKDSLKKYGSSDYKLLDESMRNTFKLVIRQDLRQYAKKINCPTLIVWGKNDKDTPLWMAKKLKKLIRNSGLIILHNSGHFCYIDEQGKFIRVAESFLT